MLLECSGDPCIAKNPEKAAKHEHRFFQMDYEDLSPGRDHGPKERLAQQSMFLRRTGPRRRRSAPLPSERIGGQSRARARARACRCATCADLQSAPLPLTGRSTDLERSSRGVCGIGAARESQGVRGATVHPPAHALRPHEQLHHAL